MKIEVKNLSFQAGEKQILRQVSAVFEGNRIYGIIGPNGSGKTTLLRHLYRQIPSRGCVFADGCDISRISPKTYARKVAVMMQHQELTDSDLRVYDVVRTGRYPYKKLFSSYDSRDEEILRRILTENNLWDLRERRIDTLSGGELQRVMISRCFAQEPDVILLDEPTNHLDIRHKLELMQMLRGFGGLVIMTLHDLNLAASDCDHIYVMKNGQIAGSGAPGEIFQRDLLQDIYDASIPVHVWEGRIFIGV